MSFLYPSEVRQLKLFGWFLLIVNACIVVAGVMVGEKLDDGRAGWWGVLALAVVVDGAFALIVGVNVLVVAMRRRHRLR